MAEKIEHEFKAVVDEVSALVACGHAENAGAILELMGALAKDKLALRYFLFRAATDERFRRLTSAQSFYVFGCDAFYFRMNAWYPRSNVANSESARRLDKYFSIDSCHNHSIDFFTVGLLGPGYATEFRETQQDVSDARIGDRISFSRTWDDQLAEGKAFFVPKSSLFHTQYHPAAYSVSLNLVIWEPVRCKQFTLAEDKETVRDVYDLRSAGGLGENPEWF